MKLNKEMILVVYMQAIKLKSQVSSTDIFRLLINCCMNCTNIYLNHFFNL